MGVTSAHRLRLRLLNARYCIEHHLMQILCVRRFGTRTTIALDDDLLAQTQAFTGRSEKSALVRKALEGVHRPGERMMGWLTRSGGTERKLQALARRRPDNA